MRVWYAKGTAVLIKDVIAKEHLVSIHDWRAMYYGRTHVIKLICNSDVPSECSVD